jgi:hypothetical protein
MFAGNVDGSFDEGHGSKGAAELVYLIIVSFVSC